MLHCRLAIMRICTFALESLKLMVLVRMILCICIGYKNILVNLDDAPKVERTYRSGDLHHERAQRATYSSETLENGSG